MSTIIYDKLSGQDAPFSLYFSEKLAHERQAPGHRDGSYPNGDIRSHNQCQRQAAYPFVQRLSLLEQLAEGYDHG